MAKTANSVNPKRAKVELVITDEIVAALAGLTTPETIDISSIVTNVGGGEGAARSIEEQFVVGDDSPILDYNTQLNATEFTIEFLYTNGKDQLGTDLIDIYTDVLFPLLRYTAEDLPLQLIYSLDGGDVGDDEILTSATETFLMSAPAPVGGVDTGGKVKLTATLKTPDFTIATVA